MTPTQFKDSRKALGLSLNEMAGALGLKTSRAIRQFERGDRAVSGPVAKLVEKLLEEME
jgi:transcriptional regulator with XRE-family HTH domain